MWLPVNGCAWRATGRLWDCQGTLGADGDGCSLTSRRKLFFKPHQCLPLRLPGSPRCCVAPRAAQARYLNKPKKLACSACGTRYPMFRGRPVLFGPDNQLFHASDYLRPPQPPVGPSLSRFVPEPSVNLAFDRSIALLAQLLPPDAACSLSAREPSAAGSVRSSTGMVVIR